MLRVALTGGIASGKSTAARIFRDLGVPVVDTDAIARDLVRKGQPGLAGLTSLLGPSILDANGELDRARLRARIFDDAAQRRQVDALLHPMILRELERELASLNAPYAVVEVPLLAEAGLAAAFDRVLLIDVPEDVQIARVQERDRVSASQARAALAAQAPRHARLQVATDIIDNTGSFDDLRAAVKRLHATYLRDVQAFASAPNRPSE